MFTSKTTKNRKTRNFKQKRYIRILKTSNKICYTRPGQSTIINKKIVMRNWVITYLNDGYRHLTGVKRIQFPLRLGEVSRGSISRSDWKTQSLRDNPFTPLNDESKENPFWSQTLKTPDTYSVSRFYSPQ